jgi:DNA-binding LytR/AlgR family response regulator
MIRCIAIDDEPLALRQMVGYISKTPFLEMIGEFDNALAALSFVQDKEVDFDVPGYQHAGHQRNGVFQIFAKPAQR